VTFNTVLHNKSIGQIREFKYYSKCVISPHVEADAEERNSYKSLRISGII